MYDVIVHSKKLRDHKALIPRTAIICEFHMRFGNVPRTCPPLPFVRARVRPRRWQAGRGHATGHVALGLCPPQTPRSWSAGISLLSMFSLVRVLKNGIHRLILGLREYFLYGLCGERLLCRVQ